MDRNLPRFSSFRSPGRHHHFISPSGDSPSLETGVPDRMLNWTAELDFLLNGLVFQPHHLTGCRTHQRIVSVANVVFDRAFHALQKVFFDQMTC